MNIKKILLSTLIFILTFMLFSCNSNVETDYESSSIPSNEMLESIPNIEPSQIIESIEPSILESIEEPSVVLSIDSSQIMVPSVEGSLEASNETSQVIESIEEPSEEVDIIEPSTPSIDPGFDLSNSEDASEDIRYILAFEDSYYDDLNGYLDNDFKINLHALLEETHINKGSYKKVWTILKEADKDPNNSSNITCIYTGRSIPIANQDTGSSGNNIWNREHIWPKSLGFKSDSMTAHNDCHHLHASEKTINATRGNLDFGEVSGGSSDSYGNKWNSSYFEPRDEVKGDIARSILYMVVRYNGDECNDCTLDLELVDGKADINDIISGTQGYIGDIDTLIKWHYDDPVSEEEKLRNEVIYSYQGNRNPFIDHEEFVAYLYTDIASLYTSIEGLEYLM